MPQQRFFHEFHLDYRTASQWRTIDFSELPYCECGLAFLQFLREHYEDVFDYPTAESLAVAVTAITAEFEARKARVPHHPFNTCVPDVYAAVKALLIQKQRELARKPTGAAAAHLYLGHEG